MEELTEYQSQKFKQLKQLPINVWYEIKHDRPDRKELVDAIKLFIDVYGHELEFNEHYTMFRKLEPCRALNGVEIKFEFHKREDVYIDYSWLPETKFKNYTKKQWAELSGRAI